MKSLKEIRKIKPPEKLQKALNERAEELMRRCDWDHLSKIEWASIQTQDDWEEAKKSALKDYFTGKFLINAIGGAKNNRPALVAVLLQLRLAWVEEYELTTVPEFFLLDFALISYYHFLKINRVIGNLEWIVNFEFFEKENPKLKHDKNYQVNGFSAEEHIEKMTESLLPSLDRYNRMFLRNLKAIRDLKRSNAILNIGKVEQLNVGERQVNISPKS